MDRMILPLFGALFLLLAGAALAAAYYTHPPIHYQFRVLGMRVAAFDLPDSLRTDRDRARDAAAHAVRDGAQCRADRLSLQAAIAAQNAAVEALRREGEARVAVSLRAVQAARAVAESERQHVSVILAARPTSPDDCKAAEALIDEEASR